MRWLRDPLRRSQLVAAGLSVSGVVALAVAWAGISRTVDVSEQMAFALSGGLGGLTIAGAGAAAASILARRRESAEELRELALLASALTSVADGIAARHVAAALVDQDEPPRRTRRARRRAT